jgi:hypothetical protein
MTEKKAEQSLSIGMPEFQIDSAVSLVDQMLSVCHTSSSPQITPNMMARLIPINGYASILNQLS